MENCNYKHGKKYIMNYNVKPTPYFLKELKRLSKRYRSLKEDVNLLVASLHENPFQGTDLGKGLHKIRMSITSKGTPIRLMHQENIQTLYQTYTGHLPEAIEPLAGAGSNRNYYRLKGTPQLIGVYGTSEAENRTFLYMARHFEAKGLPVPHVYAQTDDAMAYLQEDLGDTSLFQAIEQGRNTGIFNEAEKTLLKQTIRLLPRIQFEGAEDMDFSVCYPQAEFNRRSILWDLNYFKYCFLKATGIDFQENLLEDDFENMTQVLLADTFSTFMYRDFQSRNVMIREGKPYFIERRTERTNLLRCSFFPMASQSPISARTTK